MSKKFLSQFISSHFIKFSLIPILVVEVSLIILYFSINAYISSKNIDFLLKDAQFHSSEVLQNEAKFIDDNLKQVSRDAKILQNEHEALFKNPAGFGLPNGEPIFEVAPNKVFYKTNKVGSSLYYSAQTPIDEKTKAKATFTEAMDTTFKSVVDTNPIIVAAYFNSWDNMNRLYPFIDKVYEQYGAHIQMEDYNFYYLADLKHDPKKEPVWTGAYLDPAGNGWMLSCVVPIYNGDFLEGVTGLDITIDSFVKTILNRKLPYNANLFMINDDGMIIAMSEQIEKLLGLKELKEYLYTNKILKTIEKPEEYNILKNNSPFAEHFKKVLEKDIKSSSLNINGDEYITLQQKVDETGWRLMVLVDKKEVFGSIENLKSLTNTIGYVAIVFLLLFYVIFFYLLLRRINKFSNQITEPIENLSTQTSEIKSTDSKIDLIKTDITELSQLNSNFLTMMNELDEKTKGLYAAKVIAEESSRAKDDFLANMSHELKTPLNSINVISDLMRKNTKNNLDEKQIKSLNIINKCGKDLLFLINDVLDLSKLEAGKIELNFDTIDIKSFATSIYDMFNTQIEDKHINFNFEVDDSLKFIYCDEDRLKQIIKNLLSNALKFTPENKAISFIVKDENEMIRIIVEDEGIGIPEDKLENIFDRFKQVDSTTTRKYGGTGLGLAISKELTELLDGQITVSSHEEEGTKFEVLIPKKDEKIKDTSTLILSDKSELETKKRVLILNSDPISFLQIALEMKKIYNITLFSNLDDLISEYKNNKEKVLINENKLDKSQIDRIKESIEENDLIILFENKEETIFENGFQRLEKSTFKIESLNL